LGPIRKEEWFREDDLLLSGIPFITGEQEDRR
jgi:hypothetical protein